MATTTPVPNDARTSRASAGELAAGDLAPPPKLRRRPALIAASVAAICLGALVSLWAYNSTSHASYVLGVRQTVERGQVIKAADLMRVRISVDPALHPLAASQADAVIGRHAALDMPAGGVVTAAQITDQAVPAAGDSVVGISLAPSMLPANALRIGDRVRVVTTPGQQANVTASVPDTIAAVVVGLSSNTSQTGDTVVNVQVPFAQAPDVASLAATGRVALVLDSRER
jgi:hypothetical protein